MTKKALREQIEQVLSRKDKVGMHAIGRALVHLKNRQTEDEQRSGETRNLNGRGFQPVHANIGTSMANFYEKRGFLSPKQVAYWQKGTAKVQKPRICRYAGQLVEEAIKKREAKEAEEFAKRQMECATDFNFDDDDVEGMSDEQFQRLGVDSQ